MKSGWTIVKEKLIFAFNMLNIIHAFMCLFNKYYCTFFFLAILVFAVE